MLIPCLLFSLSDTLDRYRRQIPGAFSRQKETAFDPTGSPAFSTLNTSNKYLYEEADSHTLRGYVSFTARLRLKLADSLLQRDMTIRSGTHGMPPCFLLLPPFHSCMLRCFQVLGSPCRHLLMNDPAPRLSDRPPLHLSGLVPACVEKADCRTNGSLRPQGTTVRLPSTSLALSHADGWNRARTPTRKSTACAYPRPGALSFQKARGFLAAAGHHTVKLYDIKSTNPNAFLTYVCHMMTPWFVFRFSTCLPAF